MTVSHQAVGTSTRAGRPFFFALICRFTHVSRTTKGAVSVFFSFPPVRRLFRLQFQIFIYSSVSCLAVGVRFVDNGERTPTDIFLSRGRRLHQFLSKITDKEQKELITLFSSLDEPKQAGGTGTIHFRSKLADYFFVPFFVLHQAFYSD